MFNVTIKDVSMDRILALIEVYINIGKISLLLLRMSVKLSLS